MIRAFFENMDGDCDRIIEWSTGRMSTYRYNQILTTLYDMTPCYDTTIRCRVVMDDVLIMLFDCVYYSGHPSFTDDFKQDHLRVYLKHRCGTWQYVRHMGC